MSFIERIKKAWIVAIVAGLVMSGCSKTVLNAEKIAPKAPVLGELTVAAYEGNLEKVQNLLAAGAYINENIGTDQDQVTPLLAAISNNQKEVASLLVERGAAAHPSYMYFNASDMARYQNQFETLEKIEKSAK